MLAEVAQVRGCTFILYVCISIPMCQWDWCSELCVCVWELYPLPRETGLLSKLDSVIGSRENPNEAISISASALLPWDPTQPTGPAPALPVQTRWKASRYENWEWRKASELQTLSAAVKVTAAKPAVKYDKWWRQMIVDAAWAPCAAQIKRAVWTHRQFGNVWETQLDKNKKISDDCQIKQIWALFKIAVKY